MNIKSEMFKTKDAVQCQHSLMNIKRKMFKTKDNEGPLVVKMP